MEVVADRLNSMGADKTRSLNSKGCKGNQVDGPEQTQKKPAGEPVVLLPKRDSPQEIGHLIGQGAMACDRAVGNFGEPGKAGDAVIGPETPASSWHKIKQGEDRVGSAFHVAVGQQDPDSR